MAQANLPPDEDDAIFLREFDEVLSNANPNPARTGCPPRVVLSELAQRKRGLDDPVWQHLLKCSPCYRDFVAQREQSARPAPSALLPWRVRWLAATVIAFALAAALAGLWLYRVPAEPAGRSNLSASLSLARQTEIDLRKYAVTRSEEDAADIAPIQIPAAIVELTLLLPVGSEPGEYDLQLLDRDLVSRASAHGTGERVDYVVTVKVSVDTRTVPPGKYELALRRVGDGWRRYPALVR
jgi:hypothetical protein